MIKFSSFLALLLAAGLFYQYLATMQDAKNYPPPGDLVDVGGYKLHIQCQGEERQGVPTVIVETGIWDCSQSWQLVQSNISAVTKICTYDRAGYGWSDQGPSPRTFDQITRELEILLKKMDLHPPFIFVGHSLGGPIARYYQSQHPTEVVGMIFVDALHKEGPIFSPIFRIVCEAFSLLSHFGVQRLLMGQYPLVSPNSQWTTAMQKNYAACHQMKIKSLATCLKEWDGYEASFKDLNDNAKSLEAIPVTIISRDIEYAIYPGVSDEKLDEDLEKLNKKHLEESPHARFIIAKKSGHLVQIDRPDVVIDEIRRMIEICRSYEF